MVCVNKGLRQNVAENWCNFETGLPEKEVPAQDSSPETGTWVLLLCFSRDFNVPCAVGP